MRSKENILKCKRKVEETIKEFCSQKDSKKEDLLNSLYLELGDTIKRLNIIDKKSLCNPANKDLINKICDYLSKNDDILFYLS